VLTCQSGSVPLRQAPARTEVAGPAPNVRFWTLTRVDCVDEALNKCMRVSCCTTRLGGLSGALAASASELLRGTQQLCGASVSSQPVLCLPPPALQEASRQVVDPFGRPLCGFNRPHGVCSDADLAREWEYEKFVACRWELLGAPRAGWGGPGRSLL
jgi:hypothetical protein